MSLSIMLAFGAAELALLAGLFLSGDGGRPWRAATALSVALVAGGLWLLAAPRGEIGHPITAEATDASGAPVSTVVVLQRDGARRQVRRLPLRQPLDGAEGALWAAIALGLLGAGLQLRRRDAGPRWLAPALPAAGALAPLAVFATAGGSASGEAGVRAWLSRFDPGPLQSFTVPDLPWSFEPQGLLALLATASFAGLAVASVYLGDRRGGVERVLPLAAALAIGAVIWRIVEVGGLPWRPAEGALWAVAGLLSLAAFERRSPVRSATLCGLAFALAAIAGAA